MVDSIPDLIASTANNLKKDGWATGQTWGYEVVMPERFNFMLADRARLMTMQEWMRAGIGRPGGKAFPRLDDRAYLLVPAGAQGPGFLALQNFRVIMKYNRPRPMRWQSVILADRLRGGEPFTVQAWPRYGKRVLTRDEQLDTAAIGKPWLRCRHPGWSAWRPHPRRLAPVSGPERLGSRWVRVGGGPGAAARPLSGSVLEPSGAVPVTLGSSSS